MNNTKKLAYCALLIAAAVILNFVQVNGLWVYGGSITACSMLPIIIAGYKFGPKWGLTTGFAFSLIQLLTGLNGLKGISMATFIGAIFLDYILAFTVLGLSGVFRNKIKSHAYAIVAGSALVISLRFIFHFISGIILWGTFAPEGMIAPLYSLLYNGSYMLPELIITCIAAFILASASKQIVE